MANLAAKRLLPVNPTISSVHRQLPGHSTTHLFTIRAVKQSRSIGVLIGYNLFDLRYSRGHRAGSLLRLLSLKRRMHLLHRERVDLDSKILLSLFRVVCWFFLSAISNFLCAFVSLLREEVVYVDYKPKVVQHDVAFTPVLNNHVMK